MTHALIEPMTYSIHIFNDLLQTHDNTKQNIMVNNNVTQQTRFAIHQYYCLLTIGGVMALAQATH